MSVKCNPFKDSWQNETRRSLAGIGLLQSVLAGTSSLTYAFHTRMRTRRRRQHKRFFFDRGNDEGKAFYLSCHNNWRLFCYILEYPFID